MLKNNFSKLKEPEVRPIHQHIKYFGIRYEVLQATRWFALAFYIINQLIYTASFGFTHTFVRALMYLTEWGYFMCFFFTLVLVLSKRDKLPTHSFSYAFHTLLAIQFLITGFYWAVIHKSLTFINFTEVYINWIKHIFPMAHMFFEFLFNNIMISRKSLYSFLMFIVVYLAYNLVLNKYFDMIVYKMITWRGFLNRCHELRVRGRRHDDLIYRMDSLPRTSEFQD
jgi:hypothetical protein